MFLRSLWGVVLNDTDTGLPGSGSMHMTLEALGIHTTVEFPVRHPLKVLFGELFHCSLLVAGLTLLVLFCGLPLVDSLQHALPEASLVADWLKSLHHTLKELAHVP